MIVTLTGANDFLRKAELDRLVAAFVAEHSDLALERLDGEDTDAARMGESLSSLPFLTARKMVVLYQPGRQKAFAEGLEAALQSMAETTDAVIVEPKLDKRLSYYKTLKKHTDFREFNELDANGLTRWIMDYAKQKGGEISLVDARLLLDRAGPNQRLLQQELDKLMAYDPRIIRENIELLTEPLPQSTIFDLLDAALSGNAKRALHLYREQRQLKVEPQAVIALMAWQLHVLAVVKTAGNRSAEEVAKTAKLNPFVVRKSLGLARAITLPRLKVMIRQLLDLDLKLKSQTIDADEALQLYLLQIASA